MPDAPHVLVVEDDEDVITLMVEILKHEGFAVTVAEDGLAGLLKIQTGTPDVALLDIMMPNVDGVRVLEQLLEEGEGTTAVPVIVMTGSPDGAARSRALLGAENVFEKPFDPDDLLSRIRAVLP